MVVTRRTTLIHFIEIPKMIEASTKACRRLYNPITGEKCLKNYSCYDVVKQPSEE
jgi:hypothetical protein